MIPRSASSARRCRGDLGLLGGAEVMPFLFLVFVVGLLVIFNAWLVVDARMATASAAREGARALVEAELDLADGTARTRVDRAIDAYGRLDPESVTAAISYEAGSFGRCGRITVTVAYETPLINVPFVGGTGHHTVTMSHSELIDPYRDGDHEGSCI